MLPLSLSLPLPLPLRRLLLVIWLLLLLLLGILIYVCKVTPSPRSPPSSVRPTNGRRLLSVTPTHPAVAANAARAGAPQ